MKEYETQVLQMSVPPTESDNGSLKNAKNGNGMLPSHRYIARYPSFNLDSISYITKDRTSKLFEMRLAKTSFYIFSKSLLKFISLALYI